MAAVQVGGAVVPPYNIVITGGSKGVGRALAAEFLRAGDNVVLCARDGAPPALPPVLHTTTGAATCWAAPNLPAPVAAHCRCGSGWVLLLARCAPATPARRPLHHAGAAVSTAVEELQDLARQLPSSSGSTPTVAGIACNMARPADVAALADYAKEQLGTVDFWIKCAWIRG